MTHVSSQKDSGFALLLAIIISSVILAIGVSILHISVNQLNLSSTARESEFAFQAANAGIECMHYWRYQRDNAYVTLGTPTLPDITCFNDTAVSKGASGDALKKDGDVVATRNHWTYRFQWGNPARCTVVNMHVLYALYQAMEIPFTNQGIGNNGVKRCPRGSTCTVIISDGYNRACDEIDSSIYSIQRELLLEF